MENCTDEIQDCDLNKLGDSQILRKLLRKTGNCFKLAVDATISGSFTASSTQRTVTRTSDAVAHSSSVAAGARSVSIETSSDFTGSILGVAASGDRVYDFAVQQNDDTLGAIAYVITTGSIIITKIA